ncbi:DsbA family protein [Arcobacter porcinus]|uniref:Disulfide isomerase/thiol-disulfide oxidase n=1 Tax=Arcobacter porcinus TaxID=1935204 RepID=A0ABX2YCE3_9BACT|nr:DsbA family protein [Arcobacter porcinus]OCL88048.1 disulfide isomerase/thiol-disulfide oxidase [Arcobacter porcinus]OCL92670.1 disulfide isomerase/thiol-disulfide oxidase [Arcobacter porcinus]
MRMILKLALVFAISKSFLFANEQLVIEFEKNRLERNPELIVNSIKTFYIKKLDIKGDWSAYILDVNVDLKDKNMIVKDILFSNGEVVTSELYDINSKKSLQEQASPDLNNSYYDEKKLIAGTHGAKNSLVVFSDPLCPFCQRYIPELISYVNKNSKNIALYYYSFPLIQIHRASLDLSKLIEIAKQSDKNIVEKAYKVNWNRYFDPNSTDSKLILDSFNKELKTNIKLEELQAEKYHKVIEDEVKMAENLLVNGTPTIYINGKKDSSKEAYKKLK